jgi:DNA modification methylase
MTYTILEGNALTRLRELPDESVHCVVTSPPYWGLRDFGTAKWEGGDPACDHKQESPRFNGPKQTSAQVSGHASKAESHSRRNCQKCGATRVDDQLGLEPTPQAYIAKMVEVFREVRRVLRKDGTCWVNIGDSYAGSWGAQGREHAGKHAPNVSALSANQVKAAQIRTNGTGSLSRTPGLKPKDLCGIPWRLAFALQKNGLWLRSAIIWAKPNGMPGSQQDRPTSSYEMIFMLTKSERYYSDFDAIKTPPRESSMIRTAQDVQAQAGLHRANGGAKTNGTMKAVGVRADKQRGHSRRHNGFNDRWDQMSKEEQQSKPAMIRDVWFVPPAQFKGAHFAVMPEEIARRCILAGCPKGGLVLDPFSGSGTVGVVALRHGRNYIGIELNPEYAAMSRRRIERDAPLFNGHSEENA